MKNIVAQYGWIVLVTLIIAIMAAFATPFGKYMGERFVNSMNAAKSTLDKVTEEGVNQKNEEMNEMSEMFTSNEYKEAGLYIIKDNQQVLDKTWGELVESNVITIKKVNDYKVLTTDFKQHTNLNYSSDILDGHLVIRNDILVLPNSAFIDCKQLDCVTLGSVDVVQTDAFKGCDKLTTIIINNPNMEGFEEGAINNCPNFNTIIFNGTFLEFKEIKFGKQYYSQEVKVICTDRAVTMNFK